MGDFGSLVEEKDKALRQLKTKNQQVDDQNSHLINEVISQIAEADQKGKVKRRNLQENTSRIQRLQSQVLLEALQRLDNISTPRLDRSQIDLIFADFAWHWRVNIALEQHSADFTWRIAIWMSDRFSSQVEASAVSDGMVKEAETTEKLAQSKLQSRNESLGKQEFEKELSVIASSNDNMQRRATSLRHVNSPSSLLAITLP